MVGKGKIVALRSSVRTERPRAAVRGNLRLTGASWGTGSPQFRRTEGLDGQRFVGLVLVVLADLRLDQLDDFGRCEGLGSSERLLQGPSHTAEVSGEVAPCGLPALEEPHWLLGVLRLDLPAVAGQAEGPVDLRQGSPRATS